MRQEASRDGLPKTTSELTGGNTNWSGEVGRLPVQSKAALAYRLHQEVMELHKKWTQPDPIDNNPTVII